MKLAKCHAPCDAMQMNHKLRISEIWETCNRKRKLYEILKWQNNGESKREGQWGKGEGKREKLKAASQNGNSNCT